MVKEVDCSEVKMAEKPGKKFQNSPECQKDYLGRSVLLFRQQTQTEFGLLLRIKMAEVCSVQKMVEIPGEELVQTEIFVKEPGIILKLLLIRKMKMAYMFLT